MAPADDNKERNEPVLIGHVAGVFGVKGWVRLHSYTAPRVAILEYGDCLVGQSGNWRAVCIAEGRAHGKGVVARLSDVDDRDSAAALIGLQLGIPRDAMPEPEEGHYYWVDLEGLEVVRENGEVVGRVEYLLATGANDVLVVSGAGREILIPFLTDSVVKEVDLSAGRICVDWEWD